MTLRILTTLFFFVFMAMPWTTRLTAQLVQVGPGYVKAPFVRVYTNPDGRTHVRAPFVSVNSPSRQYFVPRYHEFAPQNAVRYGDAHADSAGTSSFRELDWSELRKLARASLAQLEANLQSSWHKYLNFELLTTIVEDDINVPFDEHQITELNEVLSRFEATLNTPNLTHVTRAAGFHDLHGALVELSSTPLQRKKRQLVGAKRQLDADLARINAPGSWRDYLQLPIVDRSEMSDIPEAPNVKDDDLAPLEATMQRYDQTAADERFQAIADLEGFQSTRLRLREYFELIQAAASPSILRSIEQLPLPQPDASDLPHDSDLIEPSAEKLDSLEPPANLNSLEPIPE